MGTDSTRCPSGSKASRFHGKAKQAADTIITAFQSGTLPKALAPIFINRPDEDTPCSQVELVESVAYRAGRLL